MTVTSYPVSSEMKEPTPATNDYGRVVSVQIGGGKVYYLSPGGSVTISGNKDMMIEYSDTQGDFLVIANPMSDSLLIRVDSQIQLIGQTFTGTTSDGIKVAPQFDIFEFIGDVMQNVSGKTAYLTWRGKTFTGTVKNFTITQRAGEGNIVDLSFTFQVGRAQAPEIDWWPFW